MAKAVKYIRLLDGELEWLIETCEGGECLALTFPAHSIIVEQSEMRTLHRLYERRKATTNTGKE